MSFYKREGNTLSIAPNGVYARDFTLLASENATYTLPIDGWHWFDTDKQAYDFFDLPMPSDAVAQPTDTITDEDLDDLASFILSD
jgi:hypothetical protein